MLSATLSKLTVGCLLMMMMMMMKETDAMPRAHPEKSGSHSQHSPKTHRKPSDATSEMVPLQLDPSALIPSSNIRALWNHSVSPWTYNTSHDENLYPPVLSEARCSLRGCRDHEGTEDLSLESRPIMYQILVLRRVKATGAKTYHYRLESRIISVGCTCVRPSVQHQD